MKRNIVVLTVIALLTLAAAASASALLPEGVERFVDESGLICFVWPDGSGSCYCPCEQTCGNGDPTPIPPTETPTDPPTVTPTDPPTETPEPKPKCNRGIGNGSEDCDPGNSYGQGQGGGRRAGEDREE